MTAEIAILNRSAVALAADSAVTITHSVGEKVYNSANKLFALSKFEPVGILVFGSASFLGVPWETIIKGYREQLHNKRLKDLTEYAEDFKRYIADNLLLFSDQKRHKYIVHEIEQSALNLAASIDQRVEDRFNTVDELSQKQISQIASETMAAHRDFLQGYPTIPSMVGEAAATLDAIMNEHWPSIFQDCFERIPLDESASRLAREVCFMMLVRDVRDSNHSGVVVAGFGSENVFPKLVWFAPTLLVGRVLKCNAAQASEVSDDTPGIIAPFAQQDMVRMFMEGAAPAYQHMIQITLQELFAGLPPLVSSAVHFPDDAEKLNAEQRIKDALANVMGEIGKRWREYSQTRFAMPTVEMIELLPKDELATVAETLVSLTSFRRRLSLDTESVGGPIDVAVISRGDGFVWIKRKHYFDPRLNAHFFNNYMLDRRIST